MKNSNIPAIFIWALYGLTVGMSLFLVAMSAGAELGFGALPGLAAGFVSMLLLGLLARGLHAAAQKLPRAKPDGKWRLAPAIAESLLMVGCLVGMVALRLVLPWDVAADPAFETAKVTDGGFAPAMPHGGMEIYLWLLHGAMLLLGNKAFAAVTLQLLLLVCAVLSLYCGVRRLCGAVPALVTAAFMGFAPYMLEETGKLTSLLFFLIFYGISVDCIAALPERIRGMQGNAGRVIAVMHYLVTGVLIGFCCYLDVAGITLLILLTGVLCFFSLERESGERAEFLANGVTVFLCCVLTMTAGYAASHAVRSMGGGSFAESVCRQLELYLPGGFRIPVTTGSGGTLWDVPVLVLLMAVGIFGFWYSRKIRGKALWLFAAVLLALMQCFGMNCADWFNAYALLYLFCAVMAGCSVSDLFVPGEVQPEETSRSEETVPAGEADVQMQKEQNQDAQDGTGLEMLDLQSESAPAIHYIENPLPLPRKKERKVLDYDYEVADDDDFDIQ